MVSLQLSPERIIAEAKRWGIADELVIQVLPDSVLVSPTTDRAKRLVDHLASLGAGFAKARQAGPVSSSAEALSRLKKASGR
jgi:hypothetical protein